MDTAGFSLGSQSGKELEKVQNIKYWKVVFGQCLLKLSLLAPIDRQQKWHF